MIFLFNTAVNKLWIKMIILDIFTHFAGAGE